MFNVGSPLIVIHRRRQPRSYGLASAIRDRRQQVTEHDIARVLADRTCRAITGAEREILMPTQ